MEKPVTPDKVILIVYSETTCGTVSDRGDRMTEQELRRRITASEKDGFRLLFEQYHAYVYHIVWNRIHAVGSPEDAEECVSDIFAELFRHFGEVEEGALKGYLGVLAKRRAVNLFYTLSRHEPPLSLDAEEAPDMPSGENIAEQAELRQLHQLLLRHIESLGEPDATIILYKYFYGMNATEIAKRTGLNPIAVRVRLSRALRKLKTLLKFDGIDGR